MRKSLIIALVASIVLLPGCAHVIKAVQPFLPTIEGKAEALGFGLSINAQNLGVDQLCFNPDGRPVEWIDRLPDFLGFVGDFVKNDAVGMCEVEPLPEVE